MSLNDVPDPFALFDTWLKEAEAREPNDPTAVALATCTAQGRPSLRMVLLKEVVPQPGPEGGFIFYTNLESRKGRDLADNPFGALCFHWKSLRRQVRVEGPVVQVDDARADAYFHSRPRDSRIGAWASEQSRPLEGRWELERRVAASTARYALGPIPRPPFWSGFRVIPETLEFWQDRPFRLHDRLVYHSTGLENDGDPPWRVERLFP